MKNEERNLSRERVESRAKAGMRPYVCKIIAQDLSVEERTEQLLDYFISQSLGRPNEE